MRTKGTVYFEKPGPQNTGACVEAARDRLKELGLNYTVVASGSGETALRTAEALEGLEASIICVTSYAGIREACPEAKKPLSKVREQLEELEVTILDQTPYVFKSVSFDAQYLKRSAPSWSIHEFVSRSMGYGLKTALEITLMATEAGAVPPDEEVMAMAGTGWLGGGADAALVVRTSPVIGHTDPENGLEVREVVAMPRLKFSQELIEKIKSKDETV